MYRTRRLVVRVVLAVSIVLGVSTSLLANSILYTFTGSSNLNGFFTLDNSTPFTISTFNFNNEGLSAVLTSPIQMISGTYGGYTFDGTPSLYIDRQPTFYSNGVQALGVDDWIIRARLSGPVLNGLSPTFLNLFIYSIPGSECANGLNVACSPSLTPPFPPVLGGVATPPNFNIGFSDGTLQSGSLNALNMVPEPSTIVLLSIGLVGAGLVRRRALSSYTSAHK